MANVAVDVRTWQLLQQMEAAYQDGNYTKVQALAEMAKTYSSILSDTSLLTAWFSQAVDPSNTASGLILTVQTVTGGTPPTDAEVTWGFSDGRSVTVTTKSLTSNVATLTFSGAHRLVVGQKVTVSGVDSVFNGAYTITVVTSNTIKYAKTNADVASAASGGTVALNGLSITTSWAQAGQSFVSMVIDTAAFEAVSYGRYVKVPFGV